MSAPCSRDRGSMIRLKAITITCLVGLSASPVSGAGFETIVLKDGQRITGEVVAEKASALYVDLGFDVLRVPREQVARRVKAEEAVRIAVGPGQGPVDDSSGFFSSGLLKPSPVKELVAKFGEAVVSIETPSSK